MAEEGKEGKTVDQLSVVSWAEFLQEHPPGNSVIVSGATDEEQSVYELPPTIALVVPPLELYCPEETCGTVMFFSSPREKNPPAPLAEGKMMQIFLTYWCRNCSKYSKIFALAVKLKENDLCEVYKFGEYPPFGPQTPARVISLVGPDRDIFLKGRRAESQGLGIGAFAYYRRVVENQKGKLIDEIIKVAKQLGNRKDMLDKLEAAKRETQFSKAVEQIKDAIPESLLIKGHNPLKLLHTALSRGIHVKNDEECLKVATDIRVVLVELAERIGEVLKDNSELSASLTRLLKGETSEKTKADKHKQEISE